MGVSEASDRARKGVQMTEGKQGAAEWLRGIIDKYEADGERSCSAMAKMFGIDCEYETCRGCMVKMMTAIADRIDAERAVPEKVTHEQPDSWILWCEDLDNAVKVGEVDKVEMMRRAKALAKKGLQ